MFERMIHLPTTTTTKKPVHESVERSTELTKVWRINRNDTCPLNDTKLLCAMYNQCIQKQLSHCEDQNPSQEKEDEFDIMSHSSWMRFVKVNIAFYAGLTIGTVFGMLIVCCMSVVVSKYFTPSKNAANESNDHRSRSQSKLQSLFSLKLQSISRFNIPQEIAVQSFELQLIIPPSDCTIGPPQRQNAVRLFGTMHKMHDVLRIHFSRCSSSDPYVIDIVGS